MGENIKVQWPGWKTVRLIGRGSYGAVYEIERDLLGKPEKAALKHISIPQNPSDIEDMKNEGYDDASITATFRSHLESIISEYSMMNKLSDAPNMVKSDNMQYIQRDDGFSWDIYIKMELLTPLMKALPAEIPVRQTEKLARDLCQALILCRRFHLVHRDIKPQNIFISDQGDYKLGDFGIAKIVEQTISGAKTGTYNYMAPEVYHNQPYGHSTDIYSLGLVLYWMLNQKRRPFLPLPPAKFDLSMDLQAQHRRLSGEALPPPADGSEELKRIVLKACAFDSADRYHTAEEMLADLEALDHAPSIRSAPVQLPEEEAEDATVGAFRSHPAKAVEPVQQPAPLEPEEEEGGTVGIFGKDGRASAQAAPAKLEKNRAAGTPDRAAVNSGSLAAVQAAGPAGKKTAPVIDTTPPERRAPTAAQEPAEPKRTGFSPEPLPGVPVPKQMTSVGGCLTSLVLFVVSMLLAIYTVPYFIIITVGLLFVGPALAFRHSGWAKPHFTRNGSAVNCEWKEKKKADQWLLAVNGQWVAAGVTSPFLLPVVPPNAEIVLAYREGTEIYFSNRVRI